MGKSPGWSYLVRASPYFYNVFSLGLATVALLVILSFPLRPVVTNAVRISNTKELALRWRHHVIELGHDPHTVYHGRTAAFFPCSLSLAHRLVTINANDYLPWTWHVFLYSFLKV